MKGNIESKEGIEITELTNEPGQFAAFPSDLLALENPLETFIAEEIKPTHEVEAALYARHEGIPAHNQEILGEANIVGIGGGGLNSNTFLGLARSGAKKMTLIDHDRVERTNLPRQFFFKEDLGHPKGIRLAKNLVDQAAGGATITGIGLPFEEAIQRYALPADIFVVGVDNNFCRLKAVNVARKRKIPAVFTMLSLDGMRCQCFLQGASNSDACLWCALPNLDPENIMPCASSIISSCFLASAFTIFFTHRALMGWGNIEPFNWREADLSGMTEDRKGMIKKRDDCPVCSLIR
jgi:molybdopterin/thiamine biosynthesis adenylyltransferase